MATQIIIPPALGPITNFVAHMANTDALTPRELKRMLFTANVANGRRFAAMISDETFLNPEGLFSAFEEAAEVAEHFEEARTQILPALGILVMEDMSPEEFARAKAAGAKVLPNLTFSLPTPQDVASATEIDPWYLDKIHVEAARAKGRTGKGVRVGVLDTGIDAGHSEFAGKDVRFREFSHSGGVVGDAPRDSGTHGTHVCGLIAGESCGVAPDMASIIRAGNATPAPKPKKSIVGNRSVR